MKVAHLITIDSGGAYKAAERISEAMICCGIDSTIVVRAKLHKGSRCKKAFYGFGNLLVSKLKNFGNILLSNDKIHSEPFGIEIVQNEIVRDSDVVILHWINRFIGYKNIENIIKMGKPVIWVMHDMWPFTGGCHYSDECFGYKIGCMDCPYIRRKGIARRNFIRKKSIFDRDCIGIVGPSKWIIECVNRSNIAKKTLACTIYNPINTESYRPLDSWKKLEEFKNRKGIPDNKKIILLGAMSTGIGDIKGFSLLKEILEKLDPKQYVCMIFGKHEWLKQVNTPVQIIDLGFISSESELVQTYNVADVFLSLAKQDNYPNVILEALACGTPVVGFRTGGIPEQVFHKKNGYLATMGDIDDIIAGITWIAQTNLKTGQSLLMTKNEYFVVGSQYKQLCEKLLEEDKQNAGTGSTSGVCV